MSNWSFTPGSPASLARTAKLTSPYRFVLAVPQMPRVPVGLARLRVRAGAVVNVLKVTPGRRTMLASARHAEVGLIAVVNDPSAAGQKVAGRQRFPSFYGRCCRSPDQHRASHDERHYHEPGCQSTDSLCSFVHLYFLLPHLAHLS